VTRKFNSQRNIDGAGLSLQLNHRVINFFHLIALNLIESVMKYCLKYIIILKNLLSISFLSSIYFPLTHFFLQSNEYLLSEGSPVAHFFREQITHITIIVKEVQFSNICFTTKCVDMLINCTKLSYLNVNQLVKSVRAQLSFRPQSPDIFHSSNLRTSL
jgi:hypothetical protein